MGRILRNVKRWVTRWHHRTRRIEAERIRYVNQAYDIQQYLERLQAASRANEKIVQTLQKRMGI